MIWRDSVGVGVLGQGLDQSVRVISQQSLSVCNAILMIHNNSETDSCLSLQSRSVLGSFGVVLMSSKVNFHVVRSALLYLLAELNTSISRLLFLLGATVIPLSVKSCVTTTANLRLSLMTPKQVIRIGFSWEVLGLAHLYT